MAGDNDAIKDQHTMKVMSVPLEAKMALWKKACLHIYKTYIKHAGTAAGADSARCKSMGGFPLAAYAQTSVAQKRFTTHSSIQQRGQTAPAAAVWV